jgi:hypothetical protein
LKNTPIENKELMRQSPHKKDEKPKTSAEVGLSLGDHAIWQDYRGRMDPNTAHSEKSLLDKLFQLRWNPTLA